MTDFLTSSLLSDRESGGWSCIISEKIILLISTRQILLYLLKMEFNTHLFHGVYSERIKRHHYFFFLSSFCKHQMMLRTEWSR